MADKIEFTRNYSDLSTSEGFQFEFYCDRCGTGYRTPFKASLTGKVANVLDAAGSFFGGVLGRAANIGERVRSASWEKAHDEAFREAMEILKPDFVQCPRCFPGFAARAAEYQEVMQAVCAGPGVWNVGSPGEPFCRGGLGSRQDVTGR